MSEQLHILSDHSKGRIAPAVYGHFIEHFGQCIYDGIWMGPNSDIPNIDGIREESVDMLRDISAPLIRWPGGFWADSYDWRDGIGPPENRPQRFNRRQPNNVESNAFGTHEFMRLCELAGAEPNLCVNVGTLPPRDAIDWLEYCNHPGDTSLTRMREQNGAEKPWKVKYWAVGNKAYLRQKPADAVQAYLVRRKYMKWTDPTIKCVAPLIRPHFRPSPFARDGDWLLDVASGIRGDMELASCHLYADWGSADEFTMDQYWNLLADVDQRGRMLIECFLGAVDSVVGSQRVELALDEWGIWHPEGRVSRYRDQPCPHRDAMFTARFFHLLQSFPERIGMATVAQTFNVIHALLRTDGEKTFRTPACHVFEMFKGHQGGEALEINHTRPRRELTDPRFSGIVDPTFDVVSVSASLFPDGERMLATFTNADPETSFDYAVRVIGDFVPASASAEALAAEPHAGARASLGRDPFGDLYKG